MKFINYFIILIAVLMTFQITAYSVGKNREVFKAISCECGKIAGDLHKCQGVKNVEVFARTDMDTAKSFEGDGYVTLSYQYNEKHVVQTTAQPIAVGGRVTEFQAKGFPGSDLSEMSVNYTKGTKGDATGTLLFKSEGVGECSLELKCDYEEYMHAKLSNINN